MIINIMFGVHGNGFNYFRETSRMKRLDYEGKKKHAKKLWEENPIEYYDWKSECIECDQLPDFFGTHDNPIPIDESKL